MNEFLTLLGISGSTTSALVYALIVLLFLFGFLKCILPVMRTRGTLKRAIHKIKAGDKKHSWQDDFFLGKGPLYSHWSEYLNNLFFADGVYHNASNVEDYINEETVIYTPGSANFSEALPGLMVSLGFLGTLIGMVVGLSGFDMGDETAIMGSIETLIPGMRFAFMTSVFGVVASVAFTLITRFVNGSTARAITSFYGAMSRYAGVLSVDPMTQIAIYQQEQTALIQTMAKDFNGELTGKITGAIENATLPLQETLSKFVTVTTQEQMRFLDAVVTRFVSHMDKALNGQFQNLADIIDETVKNQERLLTAVDGHVNSIARTSVDLTRYEQQAAGMLEKLDGYVNRLNASQKQIDEAYLRVSGNFEQMQLVSRQQAEYLKTVSSMQNVAADSVRALKESAKSVETASATLSATGDKLIQLRASFDADTARAADRLFEAHRKALGEAEAEMAQTVDALSAFMHEYTRRVDEVTASIADTVARIPDAAAAASETFADEIDRMNATLNRAQRAIDDAVDRMYGK